MSFNLVELVKDQISGQVLGQISNAVGENSDATKSVIDSAIPALLGGFMDKASSDEGASALLDAVNNQDDSILDNLSGVIGGSNKDSLIEGGSDMLGSLFGGNAATGLLSAVSGASGASQGAAGSIMGMVAPMAMSTVKRYMSGGGEMDKAGLTNMLMSQKDNIAGAMPSGLADQLGSSGFLSNAGNLLGDGAGMASAAVAGAVGNVADGAADLVGSATDAVTGAADKVGDIAGGAVDGVTGAVGNVADGAADLASSATDAVTGAAGKVGDIAGGAVDGVTGAVGNVTDGAVNLAGSATDSVSDAASRVGDVAGNAASGVKDAAAGAADGVADVAEGGASWIKKLIPIAIIAALAFLALKFFGGKAPEAPDVSSATAPAVTAAAQSGDVTDQLKGMFSSAQTSLGSITDVESAKAAIPQLTEFSGKLDGITSMADKLPDAAKPIFNSVVEGGLGQIQPMLDKVMAIPGVGAVLGGVIEPLKAKLAGLAG